MPGTAVSRRTFGRGASTRPGGMQTPSSRRGAASHYESLRHFGLLVLLPSTAGGDSGFGRQELCLIATKPTSAFTPFQKDRIVLVGPRGLTLSRPGSRSGRRLGLVLDWPSR